MVSFRWALVDIETTGLHVIRDEITEIAVIILTHHGVEQKWHRLIKPKCKIPKAICTLIGITNEMVAGAPFFEDIAQELLDLLRHCVFVAHNARFDFGFIKNGFKRAGLSYQAPVLCTIKLLKQLYPDDAHYNLSYMAQILGVLQETHHRAQADVHILHQIIEQLGTNYSWDLVLDRAKVIYHKSRIPSKLTTDTSQFPDSPGVYIFYGDKNNLPLYIGKSITLRQRVLSHFSGDYAHAKEFTLSQQVARIEVIPTAGELSALLLESELIKKHMPIYNRKLRRKTTLMGFKLSKKNGYLHVSIVRGNADEDSHLNHHGIYGSFRSMVAAKRILLQLIKAHELCPKLCGMEQSQGPCFSYQLKKCLGACIGEEQVEAYNARLMVAVEEYKKKAWPYRGAIAIKEHCPINKLIQFTVIHQWRFLGSVKEAHHLLQWQESLRAPIDQSSTYDVYRIIYSYLNHRAGKVSIFELN